MLRVFTGSTDRSVLLQEGLKDKIRKFMDEYMIYMVSGIFRKSTCSSSGLKSGRATESTLTTPNTPKPLNPKPYTKPKP